MRPGATWIWGAGLGRAVFAIDDRVWIVDSDADELVAYTLIRRVVIGGVEYIGWQELTGLTPTTDFVLDLPANAMVDIYPQC